LFFAEQIEQPRLQPEFIPDFDCELVAADFRQLQKECSQTGDELRVIVEDIPTEKRKLEKNGSTKK
jgi:hypothetical protein